MTRKRAADRASFFASGAVRMACASVDHFSMVNTQPVLLRAQQEISHILLIISFVICMMEFAAYPVF
ncbi:MULTISPECIES: hypothetical protein [Nitrosomonas]|uniref:Uncharacterized protein n=1 Tax=Nitrosomonas communis TaxID=44574 RepID=A0A0F7KD53_9PROT|nr:MULTISPECIES: hypothetical protein [Nitrosomonas]AKH36657.1 hypothetical protein AAW31_00615 [Nitrosomonas communis]UVS61698.1 hypothetical protein NX761_00655 [Nitrosomonas sp. PLL12]